MMTTYLNIKYKTKEEFERLRSNFTIFKVAERVSHFYTLLSKKRYRCQLFIEKLGFKLASELLAVLA